MADTCDHLIYPLCGCATPPAAPEVAPTPEVVPTVQAPAAEKPPRKPPSRRKSGTYLPWLKDAQEEQARKKREAELLNERVLEMMQTPEGRAELQKQIDAEKARRSFAEFFRQSWTVLEPSTALLWNWHLTLMSGVAQLLFVDWLKTKRVHGYVNKCRRVIFNQPPGSSKSRLLSVAFQAWCWLHWPGMKWICLSVNDDAAMRDARAMRDLLRSKWYQDLFGPKWKLKGDQDAVSNFGNTEGGERLSMPSRSRVVGVRGDACLVDDANDPSENEKERKEVNDNWDSTQSNRVNDMQRSLQIAVQQRTGSGDFTDHLIERQGLWSPENTGGWLHVVLPGEFDPERRFVLPEPLAEILREQVREGSLREEDILLADPRKELGEAIDEKRMPRSALEEERKKWEGTGNFEAQVNQRPSSAKGAIIKREYWNWFRLERGVRADVDDIANDRPRPSGCTLRDEHPAKLIPAKRHAPGEWDFDWVTVSLDCALKRTTRGSNWGIGVFAGKEGRRYWLDDRSQRGDILEIVEVLRDVIQKWRPRKILIEDKAASEDMKIRLLEEMNRGNMSMIELVLVKVGSEGKEQRLDPCKSTLANGMVHLLDGAPWLEDVVSECAEFPFGRRDDRVDVLTMILNHYMVQEEVLVWPRM